MDNSFQQIGPDTYRVSGVRVSPITGLYVSPEKERVRDEIFIRLRIAAEENIRRGYPTELLVNNRDTLAFCDRIAQLEAEKSTLERILARTTKKMNEAVDSLIQCKYEQEDIRAKLAKVPDFVSEATKWDVFCDCGNVEMSNAFWDRLDALLSGATDQSNDGSTKQMGKQ